MNKLINTGIILSIIARNLIIISAFFLICIVVAINYDETVLPFVYSFLITSVVGVLMYLNTRNRLAEQRVYRQTAFLAVSTTWVTMCLVGVLPYIFSGSIPLFIDAFFESSSGFTTTGASILSDIESLPKSILLWRSLTHWIGGIGIIALVIIVMPAFQMGGYQLFSLESSLQNKIKPQIKSIGIRLLLIYIGLTLTQTLLLYLGKMSLFDSFCHSFGTVATGGFSTKNASIINYSPYIQYVIMIFMLLSGINFSLHYFFLKLDFKKIIQNEEFRFFMLIISVIGLAAGAVVYFSSNQSLESSFREGMFQVISIITCTGFASADYLQWPVYGWMLIFFSMFIGGCTGSTAGGIKIIRHLVLLKNIKYIILKKRFPNTVYNIRLNNKLLPKETNSAILTFIYSYFLVLIIGTLILHMTGTGGKTAISAVATCMAGIGPGIGTVGPVSNFAHLTDTAKLTLSFLMIVGRLEVYTIMILFSAHFWKK